MASLQTTPIYSSSSSSLIRLRAVNASLHVPKQARFNYSSSVPKLATTKLHTEQVKGSIEITPSKNNNAVLTTQIYENKSNATIKLYSILESITNRIEMHNNVAEQRENWNSLLLNSINMITLTATTMAGIAATCATENAPLKLSSTLLFSAVTGMSLVMNKIQPSQLTEEQRNATRLFKKLRAEIETVITVGNATEEDVKSSMEKVLALDKAYPLPLLGGAMLEKFPSKFEPAVWWPNNNNNNNSTKFQRKKSSTMEKNNGWSEELENELRQVIQVVKRKDIEDYERLGNMALKVNKSLAIAGPLLTGIAALGSAFLSKDSAIAIVPLMAGSLASVINALEHGGQVGMVFEMYRNCGGFFKLLEETIEATLDEKDLENRENGEMFEMKVALQLGRSVSELRQLASKSASFSLQGIPIDEFASKLF